MSTTEAKFITLREALGTTGAIKRIRSRRPNTARDKTVVKQAAMKLAAKLLDASGEIYGGRWTASVDTCKVLGYSTITVTIEEFESDRPHN